MARFRPALLHAFRPGLARLLLPFLVMALLPAGVLAVSGVGPSGSSLGLGPNPVGPLHRDAATGETFHVMTEGAFVLAGDGKGRALWSTQAIRWNENPVGEGSDFAWFVPPAG